MTVLRIMASRHSSFYSPLLATVSAGFLDQEGIDGCYLGVPAHGNVIRALVAREAHVTQSAVSASWPFLDQGVAPPVVHFAQINQRDGFAIAARGIEGEFSWGRLLDGALMFVHGGQPQAMLRYGLHRQGVDLKKVHAIDAGATAAMMAAFRRGEGEFFHEQGPFPQQLEHEGVARVVAAVGDAVGPVAFSSLAALPQWLQGEPARRFMRAYRRAREWVRSAPPAEVAEKLLALFPGVALPALARSIEFYQRVGCWAGEVTIEPAHYEAALDVFEHAGTLRRRYRYQDVVVAPPGA